MKTNTRFVAIDSMRGIAALLVTFFHLAQSAFAGAGDTLSTTLAKIFSFGYLGVPIFFVISGFVIATTMNSDEVNSKYLKKFVVKRAMRLDPPYWTSIALDLGLIYLSANLLGLSELQLPSAAKIGAHLFYAQDLLGLGSISTIYWTLCLEVQFYIFLAMIFLIANRIKSPRTSHLFKAAIFISTILASLLISGGILENPVQGLFLSHWYLFMLGAICRWCTHAHNDLSRRKVFLFYCLCLFTLFAWQKTTSLLYSLNALSALTTGIVLYFVITRDAGKAVLTSRALIYLGSVSYSLYLFHAIIGERYVSAVRKLLLPWLGIDAPNGILLTIIMITALAVSILTAHMAWALIERPSMQLSKRIKPNSNTSIGNDLKKRTKAAAAEAI